MSFVSPSVYDPYNEISFVEINKRRYGEIERLESDRIENRTGKPEIRRLYLKKNGDSYKKRGKLFIWRKWAYPTMKNLLQETSKYVGLPEAHNIYDVHGNRIRDEDEIRDGGTYIIAGDEPFERYEDEPFTSGPSTYRVPTRAYSPERIRDQRRSSWMSAATEELIDYDYDQDNYSPRPTARARRDSFYSEGYGNPPRPVSVDNRSSYYRHPSATEARPSSTYRYYDYGKEEPPRTAAKTASKRKSRSQSTKKKKNKPPGSRGDIASRHTYGVERAKWFIGSREIPRKRMRKNVSGKGKPETEPGNEATRLATPPRRRSLGDDNLISDFDHPDALLRDQHALAKHKQMMSSWRRSQSGVIYNRRDQTHPDAYIIYVFLNGQGMSSQHVTFQRKQLEKGMPYVLELIARQFKVNPGKLCNMDGKKMSQVQDLMSRGAYVLVPVGQTFRDQWYFLPDNSIDTSSNTDKVRERSAQRDRYLQRQEKKVSNKNTFKGRKPLNLEKLSQFGLSRSKSVDTSRRAVKY